MQHAARCVVSQRRIWCGSLAALSHSPLDTYTKWWFIVNVSHHVVPSAAVHSVAEQRHQNWLKLSRQTCNIIRNESFCWSYETSHNTSAKLGYSLFNRPFKIYILQLLYKKWKTFIFQVKTGGDCASHPDSDVSVFCVNGTKELHQSVEQPRLYPQIFYIPGYI